jgi:site-specific DNA recombinase
MALLENRPEIASTSQKTYCADFLTKKMVVNNGEIPRYYVQNSHPAIISPDEFEAVQVELQRRKKLGRPNGCQNPLSAKLVCSECGGYYGPKVWASNTKHRKVIWQCNDKYKGVERCSTPYVTEDEVKEKFVIAFNTLFGVKEELIKNCQIAIEHLTDNTKIDEEIDKLHDEIAIVVEESKKAIYENAHKAMSQVEWEKQHEAYVVRHEKTTVRVTALEEQKSERQSRSHMLKGFIRDIESYGRVLDEFDERLWTLTTQKVVVLVDGGLRFCFRDGTEVEG